MRGLSEGQFDMAAGSFDNLLAWSGRDGGPELVSVLQYSRAILLPLYVRPEIRDWSDLRGKPLAVDAVDTAFALVLRRILLAHDLDLERGDYTLVPEGTTSLRLQSMARGDTYAGMMTVSEEPAAQAAGLVRWTDNREVIPEYSSSSFAVARPWAQQHRAELVGFLRAWLAGSRWIEANREATIEMVMADRNTSREAATQVIEDRSPTGVMNVSGLGDVLGLRTQFGYALPMGTDLSRYLDDSYLRQATGR